ncbi:tRNA (guanosine(46)-N7)-methyltransferase TrmB [Candidatus Gracilibacteria bacterium 28_42_T64]|nr:tRNA (guanosine(46)-N7)-methyltransferase TrmB [Candidatus Gracilibacteria bacterium 28_42_T64]
MINNPYIEKVKAHPNIITKSEEASKHKGKWNEFFGNNNPIVLEIGTGLGNFFSTEASKNPDKNYIGMEIKYKRVYNTAEKTIAKGGENFVVIKDFAQKITDIFADGELELTYIFFPDPWAKKDRQKKHKLLQEEFLTNLCNKTKIGGKVIFKTDHKEYFDETLEILDELNLWEQSRKTYHYEKDIEEFDVTNITEFEQIFRGHKLEICYIELTKK